MVSSDAQQHILRLQRQLDAVQRISQALFQHHTLDEIVETAMGVALEVSDTEAGAVLLARPESQQLVFHYSIGHRVAPGTAMPWTKGIAGAVFQSGKPEVIPDTKLDPRHFPAIGAIDGFVTRDLIALPLKKWEGDPIGVLEVLNKRRGRLDHDDLHILTVVSSFTALAIEQHRLIKEAKLAEIGRLVGEISHDVNNMLTPVVLGAPDMEKTLKVMLSRFPEADLKSAELARDECADFFQMLRHCFRRIQERAKLMADCVKGHIAPPHFQACQIEAVVNGVVEALQMVAQHHGVAIRAEGLAGLPELWADEMRLYNAFYNLINYAIPEVPRGGRITITGQPDPATDHVLVTVTDTGRGMPPEVRDSLFSGKAISRKRGGTGLGTKIVKDVIDAHNGQITVQSQENVGTSFHLRLPLRPHGAPI